MKKFSAIIILAFSGLLTIFLTGCQNRDYVLSDSPQYMIGKVKYTGPVFSPFGSSAPHTYAFYNINNSFVGYINFDRILISNMEPYLDKLVTVQGVFTQDEKGNILIKADNIKLNR